MRIPVITACLLTAVSVCLAVEVQSGDGLGVSFSDADGGITGVAIDGASVPLVGGIPGGLSVLTDVGIEPVEFVHYSFDVDGGAWVSAQNANWDEYGDFVTWDADGGIDDSGHLLLSNGVSTGAGMAMSNPVAIEGGSVLRISWQARTADIATTQILCVRIYDVQGNDITQESARPAGWNWSNVSMAHYITGLANENVDTWEAFSEDYAVPFEAAAVRVSLRHWTGGDHFVHIDDLHLDIRGRLDLTSGTPAVGPFVADGGGFVQAVTTADGLQLETTITPVEGSLDIAIDVQDVSGGGEDRPLVIVWTLPIDAVGWRWWDDIDTSRTVTAEGRPLNNTWMLFGHALPYYPYGAVTNDAFGLCLAMPMDEPTVGRIEADGVGGLRFVWEVALSPVTAKLGAGHASVSLRLYQHDPAWGFRSATQRYHELFDEFFVKRTRREGTWMYPIRPSQIPDPEDFGFAFLETHPMSDGEHVLCDALDIGIFYYTEPWLAWQSWGDTEERPSQAERVAKLESWASSQSTLATRLPDGGVGNSGHLQLGDGTCTGAGMASANTLAVNEGEQILLSWQARTADVESSQILCVRVYDSQGNDITQSSPAPSGWGYSGASMAHYVAGITNTVSDTWEPFVELYTIPAGAYSMRVSLRYWNGGDFRVHIDNLSVDRIDDATNLLAIDFESEDGSWVTAWNSEWDDAQPLWLRTPRQVAAESVLNCSPLDADGNYYIDHSYLWHEWSPGTRTQAWPILSDPDLPEPNTYDLYRENWILLDLDRHAGVYIDSVTGYSAVSGWENHRRDHMAVTDTPLTFSWDSGTAVQLGPQGHTECLGPLAEEVRGLGKLMMCNVFPSAMRFHAHNADIMGSEVMRLVENGWESRIRRTLAGTRIVSNLLQWGWDSDYITYEQMEEFIRGQLFWGFYPAVSSGGGPMTGGAPDRYFLHPEMYERDRPLFVTYIPVIRQLSSAGWEPVTHATVTDDGETERFGEFSEGSVFFTVRGTELAAFSGEITVDLAGCNLDATYWPLDVFDVMSGMVIPSSRLDSPARIAFPVSLDAGEVGVYRVVMRPFGPGDFDSDGQADMDDLEPMVNCLQGPGVVIDDACRPGDTDGDDDVDLNDFYRFMAGFESRSDSGIRQ